MDWTQAATQLSAPLNKQHVKSRSQSGRNLSYIEGWWAIAEANRIFGYDGWARETVRVDKVSEYERQLKSGMGWSVSYVAKVKVTVGGIIREGIGAGHGMDKDLGLAHESAIKEAETDAMKRAFMTFGNPFGLALYDKTQAMVTDEPSEPPDGHEFFDITGDPGAKTYKTNGTTPKALAARQNNEKFTQFVTEIRLQKSVEDLKAWLASRKPEIDRLPPISVQHITEEFFRHKDSLLGVPPYDDLVLNELDRGRTDVP